jgi:hypothetical protein
MQQPQLNHQDQQQFFTSAPASDNMPTSAMPSSQTTPTITTRTPPHTMSPHNSGIPNSVANNTPDHRQAMINANAHAQRQQQQQQAQVQAQAQAQAQAQNQLANAQSRAQKPVEALPTDPESMKKDKDVAELIMRINSTLLEAANKLQAEGKGADLELLKSKGANGQIAEESRDFME